jgi:hypothetical protein
MASKCDIMTRVEQEAESQTCESQPYYALRRWESKKTWRLEHVSDGFLKDGPGAETDQEVFESNAMSPVSESQVPEWLSRRILTVFQSNRQ